MIKNGIILTLAYPETVVRISDEWFLKYLHYFGIGKKDYVRAGHAALVLIHKEKANFEYYDFGRYISPINYGRVRSKVTDHELDFPLKPIIKNGNIENLMEILFFLATHPKMTHGLGTMYASVCDEVNFEKAKTFISYMQNRQFIRYAAFAKEATNCSRFVTEALKAGVTNLAIKKRLQNSQWFTPSTLGNVVIADTKNRVYRLTDTGQVSIFKSSVRRENRRFFMDSLRYHKPNLVGNLLPMHNNIKHENAQWLSGTGGGAWFELYDLKHDVEYGFRRISPYGNIDVDGIYEICDEGFDIHSEYNFVHHSNCKYVHVNQNGSVYRLEFLRKK